ncbi:FADL284Cp [Eremothecium gossypii FDAG1]|nr:FADL284Cp [Eremothecium gossypii FDAG1]
MALRFGRLLLLGRALPVSVRCYSQAEGFRELHPSLIKRATGYAAELETLEKLLSKGESFDVEKQKKYSKLSSIVDTFRAYQDNVHMYRELQDMIAQDASLRTEAQAELDELAPTLARSADTLLDKLLPPHPFAEKPCIVELRPGVGGIEAMIFTQDLLNMYIGYAQHHRWKWSVTSATENTTGAGLSEAILSIDEPGSYDRLKFESGVHRVQRIPATESKGRTHTSTAAVVVLPKMAEEAESDAYERTFKPGEIRIDVMRASGKGGQHVNTTDSAVRITHFPSGIAIHMQEERSQHRNKAKAFQILRAKLADLERKEREARERSARKDQVSSTDRSDKIRTYNFPQNRVTDHRCAVSLHALAEVVTGERLDELIDSMTRYDSEQKAKLLLKEMESTT